MDINLPWEKFKLHKGDLEKHCQSKEQGKANHQNLHYIDMTSLKDQLPKFPKAKSHLFALHGHATTKIFHFGSIQITHKLI